MARQYGHVQEVIVQNFRAKPDTAMRHTDDLGLEEYRAALAVSRLVLGPKVRLQAPPNLVDLEECRALLGAGVDDWGGVSPLTPDHVNPERPWPSLDRLRDGHRRRAASSCGPGSPCTRSTSAPASRGSTPASRPTSPPSPTTTACSPEIERGDVRPTGLPWQEPDGGFAQVGGAPAAPTCTPRSTPTAAPRTAAPTSTRCTATGTSCATG